MQELFFRTKRKRSLILEILKAALSWSGIEKGRVIKYQTMFSEIIEGKEKTRDHLFAYNELAELIEIYQLWENLILEFPGLKTKIKTAFTGGPLLPEDEQVKNAGNRPRNDSFVLLLAGKLNRVGLEILGVEGIPRTKKPQVVEQRMLKFLESDIWLNHSNLDIEIECKRPRSLGAIPKRVQKAQKQLNGKVGIVAIDCSVSLRPSGMILDASTPEKASNFLSDLLASKVVPIVQNELDSNVIGAILHMRTPVHTIDTVSPILGLTGMPITTYAQETASSLFFMANGDSPNVKVFRDIKDIYMATLSEENKSE